MPNFVLFSFPFAGRTYQAKMVYKVKTLGVERDQQTILFGLTLNSKTSSIYILIFDPETKTWYQNGKERLSNVAKTALKAAGVKGLAKGEAGWLTVAKYNPTFSNRAV
jgi:hypothetical protein